MNNCGRLSFSVFRHVATAHGTGSSEADALGWDLHSFNALDPVDVGLAASLHESAMAHVAGSTANAYVGRGPTS